MEISLLPLGALKIRGKLGVIAVNPQGKNDQFSGTILIGNQSKGFSLIDGEDVIIDGPGEYEVSSIKVTGVKVKSVTNYTILMDNLEILVGTLQNLSESHQKLKEHQILVILADTNGDASFATSIASKAVIVYGDHAKEVVQTLAKEGVKELPKYQATLEKLPLEMETILLV